MASTYVRYTKSLTTANVYRSQKGFKQTPRNRLEKLRPQPYSLDVYTQQTGITGTVIGPLSNLYGEIPMQQADTASHEEPYATFDKTGNRAYAKAYDKFRGQAYQKAEGLTAIAERASTVEMLLMRVKQVHKGASHLRRGHFVEFLNTFGIQHLPKHRNKRWSRPQDFSKLWLEYWMGWAPTIGDIYSACEALGQGVPDRPIKAGAHAVNHQKKVTIYGSSTITCVMDTKVSVKLQGVVQVTNPSMFQLNSLGLLNPALTVFQVIPFSWMVGWFINLEQVFGQISDWYGLKLVDLEIGCKTQITSSWVDTDCRVLWGKAVPKYGERTRTLHAYRRHVNCKGFPTIKPVVKLPNGLSLTRGATLVSLLISIFTPKLA